MTIIIMLTINITRIIYKTESFTMKTSDGLEERDRTKINPGPDFVVYTAENRVTFQDNLT